MKFLRAPLALVFSYCLGVQPAVAQMKSAHIAAPAGLSAAGRSAVSVNSAAARPLSLQIPPLVEPSLLSASGAPAVAASPLLPPPAIPVSAQAAASSQFAQDRIAPIQAAAAEAVKDLERADCDASRFQASIQFSALTGERLRAYSDGAAAPDISAKPLADAGLPVSSLSKASPPPADPKAEPPAPKPGITQVFKDPALNGAFWRLVAGYSVFLFGYNMYVVGMPYLISAITRNSLNENRDARAGSEAALKALIRSNRSLARIAHWAAQALSYVTIPLFMRNAEDDGPKKWFVRSTFIRAGVLALVPVLFFSTGLLSLPATMAILLGLIAAQSFFQGVSVTTDAAATTRILGAAGVTAEERTKANSIFVFVAAILAIIAPAIAGQIALIGPVMGKGGVGGAVIYAIYAGALAVAAFIYATIKLIGGKNDAARAGPASTVNAPNGLGATLKGLWVSIQDGTKLVVHDRLLRMMLITSMLSSLFADPLVFNVLPEYIEGIVASDPGALGIIMNIPGLGWFLKALTSSPMGNFALMLVMTSVGSIAAVALIKPLTKLFRKLGFKTEEALTVPFYFLAALEAPLFFLMIGAHTILGVALLYSLQSLAVGFIGIAILGLYQKNLGGHKGADINKILAAQSLLGIAAAIISTFVYGFILKDIAIGTALTIAAAATGVMALLRLFSPFLAFSKDRRRPSQPPPSQPPPERMPPASAKPQIGDHIRENSVYL